MSSTEAGNDSDTGASTKASAVAEEFKPSRDFFLAFLALCTLSLAVAFDATSLSVALPTISNALGGTALEAFWSGTSFLLSSTVLQPSLASLSNIFGRKYMIYISIVMFAAGSLVAAVAGNFTVLIAGRTVQGVGGGGLIALTEVVVTDLVPLAHRGQWLSLLSAMWSIGTVCGPLIGAGFAQNVSWRWIFYINLPVIALGTVFVVFFLRQNKIPGGVAQKLKRFDAIGSALFTASMTGFLFGLTTGGVMYEWSSFRVILPIILGFLGLVVFGWYEFNVASEPMVNKGLFNNWDMIVSYITTVLHAMVLWSILYFLVLFYQAVKFYTPVVSAVAALPETLTVAPAGMAVGIIAGKTGHYRWSIWGGWIIATLGAGILLLMSPESTVVQWVFINIPIGLGLGMLFPAMALSIQAACEPALNGQASAFFSFLRGLGQALGVALSGVVFQNVFRQKLSELPAFASVADQFSRDATIVVSIIAEMGDSPEKTALVQAYSDSLRMIWVMMIACCAVAMLLGFTVKGYSLNQEHVTEQRLVDRAAAREKDPEAA
ncbi:major facilitator superfamily transporter [Thozetella sp. PMI_491]|nr:major facilitator superfamily transporter [Thozetella sp. PMI_491]